MEQKNKSKSVSDKNLDLLRFKTTALMVKSSDAQEAMVNAKDLLLKIKTELTRRRSAQVDSGKGQTKPTPACPDPPTDRQTRGQGGATALAGTGHRRKK